MWLICVPGIGPLSAMAIQAFAPPMERFRRGRDSSAWLGLVPRQHSTGGKPKLGKMSVAPRQQASTRPTPVSGEPRISISPLTSLRLEYGLLNVLGASTIGLVPRRYEWWRSRVSGPTGLIAYPKFPDVVGQTIRLALSQLRERSGHEGLSSWEETDIAGNFIRSEILRQIDEGRCLVADVSRLNFNVTYEIGYAIGLGKRLVLIRNPALAPGTPSIPEVGIFDTLGHANYENSDQLVEILRDIDSSKAIDLPRTKLNRQSPIYLIEARFKTDPVTRIIARLKKKAGFSIGTSIQMR